MQGKIDKIQILCWKREGTDLPVFEAASISIVFSRQFFIEVFGRFYPKLIMLHQVGKDGIL
jgi:hypothetical protein